MSLTDTTDLASVFLTMPTEGSPIVCRLPGVLLASALGEIALHQVLVPRFLPSAGEPPLWHSIAAYFGLFLFYFVSVLGLLVITHQIIQFLGKERRVPIASRCWVMVAATFVALATYSILAVPSPRVTFFVEGFFVLGLILCTVVVWFRPFPRGGDWGIRFGLVLMIVPFLVHFYAPFVVEFGAGEAALWDGVTEDVDRTGRWLVFLAALSMPYCFCPRPVTAHILRFIPLVATLGIGAVATVLVRHDYELAMDLAKKIFGISLGRQSPLSLLSLGILALSAVVWTIVGCLRASSRARRGVGVGLALVVSGGYEFAWATQYILVTAGVFCIAHAAWSVVPEERGPDALFRIGEKTWRHYAESISNALADSSRLDAQDVSLRWEENGAHTRTILQFETDALPVKATVERRDGGVIGVDIRCGEGETAGPPQWSLYADGKGFLGLTHPAPPGALAPQQARSEDDFGKKYRIQGTKEMSLLLVDDQNRQDILEVVDGWIAVWPSGALRCQVYPGRGAPLDRPIPVTALATGAKDATPEPFVSFLQVLVALGQRAKMLPSSDVKHVSL